MTIDQLESLDAATDADPRPSAGCRPALPDLEEIPLHVRNVATLRGLGYSFRQIGETYGVTPQAASVILARQKALLENLRHQSELTVLSPRAVNCLGRLGLRSREAARAVPDLKAKLQDQRNCGQKTIREILDWAGA